MTNFEIKINTEFFEAKYEETYVDENTVIDYIVNVSVNEEGRNLEFDESDFKFIDWSRNIKDEEELLEKVKKAEKEYKDAFWSLKSFEEAIEKHIEYRRIQKEEEEKLWKKLNEIYSGCDW